ncbi:MAG: hypothetical protein ABID38_00375 [Candidatus Diapherotrites archaeon]
MDILSNLVRGILMAIIGYTGLVALMLFGVSFGPWVFTNTGAIVIFLLGFCYSFYFKL